MLNRRRLPPAIAVLCLLAIAGVATADASVNEFSAASSRTHVKPSTTESYTITLTNSPSSAKEADNAKITLPPGFSDPANVNASASEGSTGQSCVNSTWAPTISGNSISLTRPDGGGPENTRLCPGATLTVTLTATSAGTDGSYAWVTELRRELDGFLLKGAQPTVQVDGVRPTVTITGKPASVSSTSSANFAFSVSESAATQCKLDGAAFAPCASPAAYSNIPDGPHTFTVRATDAAGNTGEASYAWTSETRAPTAAVSSGPAALSNSRTATFGFTADEPSSFECRLDGGGFAVCSSPASYQNLADGPHSFSVRPTDAVGHLGASASYGWTIDATAPETTIGTKPAARTRALSATFSFAATEQGGFECKLDGAAFGPCTPPKRYSGLKRGGHSFEVRSVDRAGNVDSTPAVYRWTIAVVRRAVKATSALLAPRAGARVSAPPLLAWRRVPRASYYNVQLYRGRVKVLSTWPTRTRVQLRDRWTYLGRQRRLSPGVYRWYVWPGYGSARLHRYGALLGRRTFTMTSRQPRR
jgi:hypothetical protein